ncbi:AAA family ATPase [Marinilactibacillus kalidii]
MKRLRWKNFRLYKKSTTMYLKDFTTIVGKNDSGKSTFL